MVGRKTEPDASEERERVILENLYLADACFKIITKIP